MSKDYDENRSKIHANRNVHGNVTRIEYKRWVKWLRGQGYSGPFAGLRTTHQCVKLLAKELRKKPPTIIETCPRDPRTIVAAFNRFERPRKTVQIRSKTEIDLEEQLFKNI